MRTAIIGTMPFPSRIFAALALMLCQACSPLERLPDDARAAVTAHEFHFEDGGSALYFVLDKRPKQDAAALPPYPATYLFVIPGSECASMQHMLPGYFDGLGTQAGATRIFLLHKRFIASPGVTRCSPAFTKADHPGRWLADQNEFIRTELAAAKANGQTPQRIVIAGISEGAEIAPLLARRLPGVTHLALLANGGMDPFDAYRLQMQRHGWNHALEEIARLCTEADIDIEAAERPCRYWRELQEIRHTRNLLALDIPIFIAMGEADDMVPIESAWHIRDRFAEQGKNNLALLTFPGAGHDFRRNGQSLLPSLWEAFAHWLKK